MKTKVQNYQINNFKIVGRKLIIAVLLVLCVSAFAQENTMTKSKSDNGYRDMKSPGERVEAQLKKMAKELGLDANQQTQMKSILLEQSSKMEAMRTERMANKDNKPSKQDREAMKAKRDEAKTEMDSRIKAVLNSSQFEKYKAMQEANKAKMQERMKEKMGNNDSQE